MSVRPARNEQNTHLTAVRAAVLVRAPGLERLDWKSGAIGWQSAYTHTDTPRDAMNEWNASRA